MSGTRLTPLEKIGYGLGDFASNVVFQAVIIFLLPFYTDVYGLDPAAVATLFLAVRLLDMVIDPIMGMIADRTQTRWGRYRPYLLWFSIPFAALLVLTFVTPNFGEGEKLTYAYLTYGLLMILYTAVNIPYCALNAAITADSQERVSANSYRFFFANLAGVLIAMFVPGLVEHFGNGNEQADYPWAMGIFAVIAVLAFFGCFALVKERAEQAHSLKGNFGTDLKALFENDQWMIVAIAFFIVLIAVVLRASTQVYYVTWYLGSQELIGRFVTTGLIGVMLGATVAAHVTEHIEKVSALILSQFCIVLGSVALYFTPSDNVVFAFALFFVISFCLGMNAPILFSMAADTVEYGELKDGRRLAGLVSSGALFAIKLGVAVAGWLAPWLLARNGYDAQAATQTPEAVHGIVLSLTIFPAVGHFLVIPIVTFYRLNKTRCEEIRTLLNQQASA
jgi:GPH family glycoside/pentoside/hexuronide:cation symporter